MKTSPIPQITAGGVQILSQSLPSMKDGGKLCKLGEEKKRMRKCATDYKYERGVKYPQGLLVYQKARPAVCLPAHLHQQHAHALTVHTCKALR